MRIIFEIGISLQRGKPTNAFKRGHILHKGEIAIAPTSIKEEEPEKMGFEIAVHKGNSYTKIERRPKQDN